jgi:hypothetical protein
MKGLWLYIFPSTVIVTLPAAGYNNRQNRKQINVQCLVITFGFLPSVVFIWFVTNQRKTSLGNNPKVITTCCNPGASLKSHMYTVLGVVSYEK